MRRVLLAVSALAAALALGTGGGRVAAHAELESSTPAADSGVTAPVASITLTFSEGVEPTADGFLVTLPDASVVDPTVTTTDGAVYELTLDAPVTSGAVSVGYSVVSADGHPIDGGFSFEVHSAHASTAVPAPPTTAGGVAPTVAPPASEPPASEPPATVPPATVPPATGPPATVPPATGPAEEGDDGGSNAVLWVVLIGAAAALAGGSAALAAKRR